MRVKISEKHCYTIVFIVTAILLTGRESSANQRADASTPVVSVSESNTHQPLYDLKPRDLVRLAVIGDPGSISWIQLVRQKEPVSWSLDGRYFAALVRWGDPEASENKARLVIFALSDLSHPVTVVEFGSKTNFQPIALVKWAKDNSLYFSATSGDSTEIYHYKFGHPAIQLTKETRQIIWYDVSGDGNTLALLLAKNESTKLVESENCAGAGCRVTADNFYDATHESSGFNAAYTGDLVVYNIPDGRRRDISHQVASSIEGNDARDCYGYFVGGISPDGRYVIEHCHAIDWPEWWSTYKSSLSQSRILGQKASHSTNAANELFIIDLSNGNARALTGAPYRWPDLVDTDPIWINDGAFIVLPNADEPLQELGKSELIKSQDSPSLLAVEPSSGHVYRIDHLGAARISALIWDSNTQILTANVSTPGKPDSQRAWHFSVGRWSSSAVPDQPRIRDGHGPKISVRQSLNDPPCLVAQYGDGQKIELLHPNDWLKQFRIGRAEAVTWNVDGKLWHGQLYYPPEFDPRRKYAVVLQTHGGSDDEFSLVGVTNNFPARALAARNILVLQIHENEKGIDATPQEWPGVQRGYEAAVEYLDGRGFIDRTRVGIIGWSRTGLTSSYTLTHSDYPFAAAAFVLSANGGPWEFLNDGFHGEMEVDYGALPVGLGEAKWLETSPAYSIDRMRTPILMFSRSTSLMHWDWYAMLTRLDRPVEYWQMSDPTHDIFRIEQRVSVAEKLTNWFDFWLNGNRLIVREDLERWSPMIAQQERVMKTPRSPLLRWTASPKP